MFKSSMEKAGWWNIYFMKAKERTIGGSKGTSNTWRRGRGKQWRGTNKNNVCVYINICIQFKPPDLHANASTYWVTSLAQELVIWKDGQDRETLAKPKERERPFDNIELKRETLQQAPMKFRKP